MGKNVGQRFFIIGVVIVIGIVLLWPPGEKLRPGLDIAGGTSMIFEIDTTGAEGQANLAERVKTLLQKRVDPSGVYNLTWRVQGRNRIEVQMPLPPKDAMERRKTFADALDHLYSYELRRGAVEEALRLPSQPRLDAIEKLSRGNADAEIAALQGDARATWEPKINQVVADRKRLLTAAAERYDTLVAAEAAKARGPVESQPATEPAAADDTTTAPATPPVTAESLNQAYRDAAELFEDAVQDVLATNVNRRRFEEIVELDAKSTTRQRSLAQIMDKHADLHIEIRDVLATNAAWRSGKRFLDGPSDLKRLLHGAGKLEFRILPMPDPGNPTKYDTYHKALHEGRMRPPGEYGWFRVDNPMQFFGLDSPAELEAFKPENHQANVVDKFDNNYYVLSKISPQDGLLQDATTRKWRLNRARVDRDEHGRWAVSFELDAIGGQLFGTLTRNNIEKPLCILVDDVAYSSANIKSEIRTQGQITGEFSLDKVNYLVQTMEGGMLPARLKETPLSERTIGSSLGETNRDHAVRAGLIGTAAVVVIMVGYYFLCGTIATLATLLNVFLTIAALAMLGARITLDGIAGLVLAVGMAVDANVLIYERMREEKERGASLRMIIKNGYDRALSTIFDSNMTTLLTCVIIYYVGSEEVKGFGLTLGWGIALNLFTAVFVTRTMFDLLLKYNLIKDVKMMKLISVPNINWFRVSKLLLPVTVVATFAGLTLLFVRGKDNVFDIEFLGGVAAEFEVKESKTAEARVDDVAIRRMLQNVSADLKRDSEKLGEAVVQPVAGNSSAFTVQLAGVEAQRLAAMLTEPLEAENVLTRGGVLAPAGAPEITLHLQSEMTAEALAARIHNLQGSLVQSSDNIGRANVNAVLESGGVAQEGLVWNVTTTATNMRLVEHALASALGDRMRVQPSVNYVFRGQGDLPYPINDRLLDNVVPELPAGVNADVTDYLGGAAVRLDQLDPPQSVPGLRERLDNMHFQPDFQDLPKRRFDVIGVTPDPAGGKDDKGDPLYVGLVIVAVDPDIRYRDDPQVWATSFVPGQMKLTQTALRTEQSLRKVMQFKPQIAAQASQQGLLALLLSWAMIVVYIWIRFGRLSFGVGAVVALIHDVLFALACVGFAGYISNTAIGRALLIEDFKINMPIVAALLTIIGYSINDKIVVFDRIRELRGRLTEVSHALVNDSINQCMSRTILTGTAVLVVLAILYIWGGTSVRGFAFCMFIGVVCGTYSSIAVAAPLLLANWSGHRRALVPARA